MVNFFRWIFAVVLSGSCAHALAQERAIIQYDKHSQELFRAAIEGKIKFANPNPPSAHTVALTIPEEFASIDRDALTLPWTKTMLRLFVKHKTSPNRAARGLAIMHVALHDSIVISNAICKSKSSNLSEDSSRRCVSHHTESAIAGTAGRVLRYLFNAEEAYFDRVAEQLGKRAAESGRATSDAVAFGLALGQQIGEANVAYAETDGAARGWNGIRLEWYGEGRYYGPGTWEPTPPYFYYPPEEPFAPAWRTWFLKSANQYRPTPPDFASERYMRDLLEVKQIAENLTPEQKKIAVFWADGRGSVTPPGHWNNIAIDLFKETPKDSLLTAEIFARMNRALADSFVAAWDAKYAYWTARPITAAKSLLGNELKTAILTPPFPSYVSGHATFSGAAGMLLGHFFPAKQKQLNDMAEEAAMSRLYGGIHFRFDNDDGLVLGRQIGRMAISPGS